MVYGYSVSGFCCPSSYGTDVRAAGQQQPARADRDLRPGRAHAVRDRGWSRTPARRSTSRTRLRLTAIDFEPWLDPSGIGLELHRTDVSANGQVIALKPEQWNTGTQDDRQDRRALGLRDRVAIRPARSTASCRSPASRRTSRSPRTAAQIAWTDGDGLKVAGDADDRRTTRACSSSPAVVISRDRHERLDRRRETCAAFLPPPAPPVSRRPSRRRRSRRRRRPIAAPRGDALPAKVTDQGARRRPPAQADGRRGGQGHDLRDRPRARRSAARASRSSSPPAAGRQGRREAHGQAAS